MKPDLVMRNYFLLFSVIIFTNAAAQINTTKHTIDSGFQQGYWLYATDFDQDGDTDIVAASHGSGLKWYRNDGFGVFTKVNIDNAFKDAWSVHAADLDNDGDNDVIAVSMNEVTQVSNLTWFELKGNGSFTDHNINSDSGSLPQSVFAADLDNDGDKDILVAAWGFGQVKWWENSPGAVFVEHTLDANFSSAHSITAVDLNNNGRVDIIGAGGGKTSIWRNNGNLSFTRKNLGSGGGFGVFTYDLNSDGLIDILRTQRGGNLDWFRSKDGVKFTTENIIAVGMGESWSMAAGDFDLDGDNDIVAAGYVFSPNKISFFLNDGSYNFSEQVLDSSYTRPRGVVVADFDQDGDEDVAAVITKADQIVWYEVESEQNIKTITVTAPNGGESLGYSSSYTINWNYTGSISNVRIDYSLDNGSNWTPIVSLAPNAGSHIWTTPNTQTSSALIRVSDATDGTVVDVSDAVFSIGPSSISVISPNGGESLAVGIVQNIGWTSTGGISAVKIEYSLDNGANWNLIQSGVSNIGSIPWTVPDLYSTQALVRVSENSVGIPVDESDAVFTLSGTGFTVTSPNGSEIWSAGSSQQITWNNHGSVPSVSLEYSIDSGTTWIAIAANITNSGTYDWTTPAITTGSARIRVLDSSYNTRFDASDEDFTISVNSITVTAPNGSETWQAGTFQLITWNSEGSIPTVKIEYSTNSGASWQTIVAVTANTGSSSWLVPNIETAQALVRITNATGSLPTDVSDAEFSIKPEVELTLLSPNGGESWQSASTYPLIWTGPGSIFSVMLEFSADGGTTWQTITTGTTNDGSYNWLVPNTDSDDALIRISDAADGTTFDRSDSEFTILPIPEITISSPNGGEIWAAGTEHLIIWTSLGNISAVNIEHSQDDGATWVSIISATENDGAYNWTCPAIQSGTNLVRVSDASSGIPADQSDAAFGIQSGSSLALISPNGGETWVGGTTQEITWTAPLAISALKLENSQDNGLNWNPIVISTPNTGSYNWRLPTEASSEVLVRISDVNNTGMFDESDMVFSISQPQLAVTAPNGGEVWTGASSKTITWDTINSIDKLNLFWSPDNGSNWIGIAENISNNGSFVWSVPDLSSDQALVRISETSNEAVDDVSDAVFRIIGASLSITSPNGGETVAANSAFDIRWSASGVIINVKIEYSIDGNSFLTVIESTPNNGFFSWNVPNVNSQSVVLRLSDANDGSPEDLSDDRFTITTNPTEVAVDPDGDLPSDFALYQNFPNPFNLGTKIKFAVAQASQVDLRLFNIQGELITTLFAGVLTRGNYSVYWNGLDAFGMMMPSGIYIYQIRIGDWQVARKLMLVK